MPINDFIISSLNVREDEIKSIDTYVKDGVITIELELISNTRDCPYCSGPLKIKDYRKTKIIIGDFNNHQTVVIHKKCRYVCKECNKTLTKKSPLCFKNTNISFSVIQAIMNDLRYVNETIVSIAERYHLSCTTIQKYADSFLIVPRLKLSESIGLDEIHSIPLTKRNSSYLGVIVDNINRDLLELLPSRSKDELRRYFSTIPKEERLKVKYVTTDLWRPYKDISNIYLPNAKVCADPFHVIKNLNEPFNKFRVSIMNQKDKNSTAYYLLKNWWKLLLSDEYDFDINANGSYNKVFGQYMNYYELRKEILKIDDNLYKAYELKEEFRSFIKDTEAYEAEVMHDEVLNDFIEADLPCYKEFIKTIKSWKEEIINSFDKPYDNRKQSNALAENINSKIQKMISVSNGLTNYERTRARALYILNKRVHYSISDTFKSNKVKGRTRGKYNK